MAMKAGVKCHMISEAGMLCTDTRATLKCTSGLKQSFIHTYKFPWNISLKLYLC